MSELVNCFYYYWILELVPQSPVNDWNPLYYTGYNNGLDVESTGNIHHSPKFTDRDVAQRLANRLLGTKLCKWEVREHGFQLNDNYAN